MSRARLALSLAVTLAACTKPPPWEGTFDVPDAGAVLQPQTGGPFIDPVGYVASLHGGQIAMLDLRQGTFLSDQPTASFVRSAPLSAGRARILSGLAVYAPDQVVVDVFATDRAYGHLLRIPHVVGADDRGAPIRHEPTATEPLFVDADSSGDSARVEGLVVRLGYTSTEDWTLTYDGETWRVVGSRSGPQEKRPRMGETFEGDRRVIELRVEGTASAGDRIEFSTDSGIAEIDLGGTPTRLAMAPDQSVLAVAVQDTESDTGALRLVDPAAGASKEDVPLPLDAIPGRMAWSEDSTRLFVSDVRRPAAYEVVLDAGAFVELIEHTLPWPVFDVAPMLGEREDVLWVAPVEGRSVWLYDLRAGALRDYNPLTPGVDGLYFDTPVRGLETLPLAYQWLETDDEGTRIWGRSVAVSLFTGRLVFLGEHTHCLVQDPLGPRTDTNASVTGVVDYTTNFAGSQGAAFLERNGANDRSVLVNRCAGVARRETWSLTYKRDLQAWEVEGSRSGVQQALVYEDQRYVSDEGAFSLTLRGGTQPSQEGWRVSFSVSPGMVEAQGYNDQDRLRDVELDLPSDPVFFHHDRVETQGEAWSEVRDAPFVMVAASASDLVGRIDPVDGRIEVAWW